MWGERAAEATVGAVQAYVSRLRRLFGPDALPRHGHGYVLDRGVVAVDADLFVADVDAGRRALARGNDEDAAALLEVALARWTGPCAFGVDAQGQMPFLAPVAARLEELRVVATEALADAHARQGRAADDVALLEELAARDPLRESVAVQLVRALYAAAGRPTRWPPTTAAGGPWPTSSGSSPRPRCARCARRCWPTSRCPVSAAPSCPPTCRRGTGRSWAGGACSRPSTRLWTTTPAARAPSR